MESGVMTGKTRRKKIIGKPDLIFCAEIFGFDNQDLLVGEIQLQLLPALLHFSGEDGHFAFAEFLFHHRCDPFGNYAEIT